MGTVKVVAATAGAEKAQGEEAKLLDISALRSTADGHGHLNFG
jgi:hypothetical protein